MLTGLVSISFRKLSAEEIVSLVARSGLDGIEWGGDVHVPHGDVARARAVRRLTEEAGLQVASYGSYYRVGCPGDFQFDAALDCALELGAPVIRVWAGDKGSAVCPVDRRTRIVAESRELAAKAAKHGIVLAYEFHGNTLTDTVDSCLELLKEANHPNLKTYWQPPSGMDQTALIHSLTAVLPHLSHLHVFMWRERERLPLAAGGDRWPPLMRIAEGAQSTVPRYAMIEFVRDDSAEQFLADAAALKRFAAF